MNPKIWAKEVTRKEFLFAFFDLLLLIVPGAGILYVFNQSAFESMDWIKIVLLSGAMTAPLSFLNTIFLSTIDDQYDPKRKNDLFFALSVGIVVTSIILYTWAATSYLWWNSSPKAFGTALIFSELVFGVVAGFTDVRRQRKKKK